MHRPTRSPRAARQNTISTIPEELLERILALCIESPEQVSSPRVPGAVYRTAPLLVCRRFLRIATPLFYHTLALRSPRQAQRLYYTLASNPLLATFTRKLVIQSSDVHDVSEHIVRLCRDVEELDLLLVDGGAGDVSDGDAARVLRFSRALGTLGRIRSVTLRKPASTYLTHERTRLLLEGLADAVKDWRNLELLTFAFRLSSTPSTDLLIGALAKSPRLHTVRAVMPTVLNSCFVTLSTNPTLRNIELITDETPSGVIFGTGNGLFLKEARKHERLWACVRRGTPTVRARANTYSPPATAGQQIKPTQSMGSLAPSQGPLNVTSAKRGSRCPPPPSASAQYAAGYYYASGAGQYRDSSSASSSYYCASRGTSPAAMQVDSGYRAAPSPRTAAAGSGVRRGTR